MQEIAMQVIKQSPDTVLYSTADLTAMGYGSRATIWRRRKAGTLIKPAVTIGNRDYWTQRQLLDMQHPQQGAA
jgi:hypothetical protein